MMSFAFGALLMASVTVHAGRLMGGMLLALVATSTLRESWRRYRNE